MKHLTQCEMVLDYISRNSYGITDNDARDAFGVHRLAARIKDLRDRGIKIDTIIERDRNRFDAPVKFARYVLVKPDQPSLF